MKEENLRVAQARDGRRLLGLFFVWFVCCGCGCGGPLMGLFFRLVRHPVGPKVGVVAVVCARLGTDMAMAGRGES